MTYFHDTTANVQALVHNPGVPTVVARAWLRSEGQATNNPSNPLNILYYHRPPQIGAIGRFARYASPAIGLGDAARLINNLSYYTRVRAAIKHFEDVGGNAAILAVARAIEDSPWAAGHYGGGGAQDGSIVRYVKAHMSTPTPPPPPATIHTIVVRGWTPVYNAPEGSVFGHLTLATYQTTRKLVDGVYWYRVVGGALNGKWIEGPTVTPR